MTVGGWRARIGYLRPTSRGNAIEYWLKGAPEGVTFTDATIGYPVRSAPTKEEFLAGLGRAKELSAKLAATGCDAIAVIGTPPFLMLGPAEEERWARELESEIGVPVTTAMLPHAKALLALGCRNILAITYYGDTLNSAITRYFEDCGLRVSGVASYTVPTPRERDPGELQTSSHEELNTVDFPTVYRHVREAFLSRESPVDAIYINGSGWNAEPAVRYLERDLGVPVVWAQHAVSWFMYRSLHINAASDACRLHQTWPELPQVEYRPSSTSSGASGE